MTIPERINYYLKKKYVIEYTMHHDIVIYKPIKVTDLVKMRRYLNSHGIDYRNIVVK